MASFYRTDDPVRDANNYYADVEAHPVKKVYPRCDYCDEVITDDECYEIGTEIYCRECMRMAFAVETKSLITYR